MGVDDIFGGLLQAGQAPFGFLKDAVTHNPFSLGDRYKDLQSRLGQMAEGAFGPDRGLGAAFGLAPEAIRDPVRDTFDPLFATMEFARDEIVSQPLATAITVGSLSSQPGDVLDLSKWGEAYEIAEHRSPGQAAAFLSMGVNLKSNDEIEQAMSSDEFQMISGTFDAIAALTLDPTVLAGKGVSAYRAGRLGLVRSSSITGKIAQSLGKKTMSDGTRDWVVMSDRLFSRMEGRRGRIFRQRAINEADRLGLIDKFVDDIDNMTPADLRAGPFANMERGAVLSHLIGSASDREAKRRIVRLAMGGSDEYAGLQTQFTRKVDDLAIAQQQVDDLERAAAQLRLDDVAARAQAEADIAEAQRIVEKVRDGAADYADAVHAFDELTVGPQVTRELHPDGFEIAQRNLDRARAEVQALYDEKSIVRQLTDIPKVTTSTKIRTRLTRNEDWYQKGPFSRTVRNVYEMEPHHMVRLDDPAGDIHVNRFMQELNALTKGQVGLDDIDEYRQRYMAASRSGTDAVAARRRVLEEMEEKAFRTFAEDAGLAEDEIRMVLGRIGSYRQQAIQKLEQRVYGVVGEGNELIRSPMLSTQLQDVFPLVDLREVAKVTKLVKRQRSGARVIGRMKNKGLPVKDIDVDRINNMANIRSFGPSAVEAYYKVWKPLTLLRVGWPIRVVGDEQLRLMAKLGALAPLKHLGRRVTSSARRDPLLWRGAKTRPGTFMRRTVDGVEDARQKTVGFKDDAFDGFTVETPRGTVKVQGIQDTHELQLARSDGDFARIIGQEELTFLDDLRGSGEFTAVLPDQPGFAESWERAVNLQLRQDPLAMQLLEGVDAEDAVKWLRSTPEGRAMTRRVAYKKDLEAWVDDLNGQIDRMLPSDELRQMAAKGQIKFGEYAKRVAPEQRRAVHGEILAQSMGRGPISQAVNRFTTRMYRALGAQPTNVLSRQPYFATLYTQEMKRMIAVLGDDITITDDVIRTLQGSARDFALRETRGLLYSLAESSRFAETMRFVAPFYNAWQEVLTVWGRLAVENPAFIRQMQIVYRSPEAAGLVTDGEGNIIGPDGKIKTPVPGRGRKVGDPAADDERRVQMDLPEAIKNVIPGARSAAEAVQMALTGGTPGAVPAFDKSSLNMVLQGPPGFGPPVQVPVNEIVRQNPNLEAAFKIVLPYGATENTRELLLPSVVRRIERGLDEDNKSRVNLVNRIYIDKLVTWELGRRPDLDGLTPEEVHNRLKEEANDEGDKMSAVKVLAGFFSPVSVQIQSPYQMHIDAYRARREWDAEQRELNPGIDQDPAYQTPDEWFYDTFGPEFFALSQSLSQSQDGVPPTLEGYNARAEYKDLIEAHPELGGLIIGQEGAGEFNRTVYEMQFANTISDATDRKQRATRDAEQIKEGPDVRRGWLEYRSAMDILDGALEGAGLANYQVKAAQPLALAKRAVLAFLSQKYPAWAEEYYSTNQLAWDNKIEGMERIVADHPKAQTRPDLVGLAQYLYARRQMQELLTHTEASTLTASSNRGLALAWDSWVQQLVNGNTMFAALYYRYLENDPLRQPVLAQGLVA